MITQVKNTELTLAAVVLLGIALLYGLIRPRSVIGLASDVE